MNNILELKGRFEEKKENQPSGRNIPTNSEIRVEKIVRLINDLNRVLEEWDKYNSVIPGVLITARYINVVSKSNRCQSLLSTSGATTNSCIVGAKFIKKEDTQTVFFQHNITYYVTIKALHDTISKLDLAKKYVEQCSGILSNVDISNINDKITITPQNPPLKKSALVSTIVDAYYVEKFYIDMDVEDVKDNSIITIYDTKIDAVSLLDKLGISIERSNILSNNTMLLKPGELSLLKIKAPYLISMAVSDLSQITKDNFEAVATNNKITIPSPTNEPVVGVIDTLFDTRVYFSNWV
jgi:hypothetical protein